MKEKNYAGIDLGTTYCCIALYTPGGKPLVEKNLDGVEDMPSVIHFDGSGNIIVGTGGKEKLPLHPENTASFFKSWMGKDRDFVFNRKHYSASDLSAMLLTKLIQDVSRVSGLEI